MSAALNAATSPVVPFFTTRLSVRPTSRSSSMCLSTYDTTYLMS